MIDFDKFVFDARPDTVDFRDRMYEPTLVEVPTRIDLDEYKNYKVPVLNQGLEGACTGFGLVTVANYLLRKRRVVPDPTPVSPRMFYEMAKRYDEWPGESYKGSSARGAMKGWHKHGACSAELWPYDAADADNALTYVRVSNAATRPLGAYYRVNHKDLVSMHSALADVGILFASGAVHDGWKLPDAKGVISYEKDCPVRGGHAFAIVAYDQHGFWIQNSWGTGWGKGGFAQITYDDWLVNGSDVWVARLGVPVSLRFTETTVVTIAPGAAQSKSYSFSELHPHIISIGYDGVLGTEGMYATSDAEVAEIFKEDIPRRMKGWEKKRLLLYAHGGLVGSDTFTQRVAEYRVAFQQAQVYPLAFAWHTDFWNTMTDILQEALRRRRPEGVMSGNLDFMLDRLDETLEPLVRTLMGRAQWDELKRSALAATRNFDGGAHIVLKYLADWVESNPGAEIHLAAHSAGSIFLAPLVRLLTSPGEIKAGWLRGMTGYGLPVASCTLWAPSIRIADFRCTYLPAINSGGIQRFALYTLTDPAEQDDHVAEIYNKSLLYLISNAMEEQCGEALLGLEKCVQQDRKLAAMFDPQRSAGRGIAEWVRSPNNAPKGSRWASTVLHHGDFDDDSPTLVSTLARILDVPSMPSTESTPAFDFKRSEASLREKRVQLDQMTK